MRPKDRYVIMIVSPRSGRTREINLPMLLVSAGKLFSWIFFAVLGYAVFDYLSAKNTASLYHQMNAENNELRTEAKALSENLDEVKESLRKVQDYAAKLTEMTSLKVEKLAQVTGVGALTKDEVKIYQKYREAHLAPQHGSPRMAVPLGVNADKLVFRPVFEKLAEVGEDAERHTLKLQSLLTTLTEQKSVLSAIPSVSPLLNGWVTSRFGSRVSPFTGDLSQHKGIDVAAPEGTPIYAPADGVVVFVGIKEGFGNYVMIAHGYGVVTAYGHNAQNLVNAGQTLKRGERIATVGQTGRTTGPHLHYEVWHNGRIANPEHFILDLDNLL